MLLRLKIKPNQRFDKVEKVENDWQIRLKTPAIDGKANEHLVQYLATILELPQSAIQLTKGLTSRHKTLEVNSTDEYVVSRLTQALTG